MSRLTRVKVLIVLAAAGADAAWNFAGAFWGFTILALAMAQFGMWMASAASHASTKAIAVEQRVNAHQAVLNQHDSGKFTNVSGNATVQMTAPGSGTYTLKTGTLSQFTSQVGHMTGVGGTDPNSGASWASGERGYINKCIDWINNSLLPNLNAAGIMS